MQHSSSDSTAVHSQTLRHQSDRKTEAKYLLITANYHKHTPSKICMY